MNNNIEKLDCGCEYQVSGEGQIKVKIKTKTCAEHAPKIDLVKSLADLKERKIKEIKNKTGEVIQAIYPMYTQNNILFGLNGYNATDKTNCKNFINDKIAQGELLQKQVEAITNIEDLEAYTFEFIETKGE